MPFEVERLLRLWTDPLPEDEAAAAAAFREMYACPVTVNGTPIGRLPPSGQRIDLRIIDVLTFVDGQITDIWMVADWLHAFTAAGALRVPADLDEAAAQDGPHGSS